MRFWSTSAFAQIVDVPLNSISAHGGVGVYVVLTVLSHSLVELADPLHYLPIGPLSLPDKFGELEHIIARQQPFVLYLVIRVVFFID